MCGLERPARLFSASATKHPTGAAYRKRICRDCEERARRAKAIAKRHQRYDARGFVWCNNCKRYRSPGEFKRHPLRPHTYWSYCKECTRVLDRLRLRNVRGTEEWKRDMERRAEQHRRQRSAELEERRQLVQDAIALLRRRGLTKAEICRLADVSFSSLIDWERGRRRCVSAGVGARFGELLAATSGLTPGAVPTYKRRLPHPEVSRLMERMAPVIAAYPVRSRWKRS